MRVCGRSLSCPLIFYHFYCPALTETPAPSCRPGWCHSGARIASWSAPAHAPEPSRPRIASCHPLPSCCRHGAEGRGTTSRASRYCQRPASRSFQLPPPTACGGSSATGILGRPAVGRSPATPAGHPPLAAPVMVVSPRRDMKARLRSTSDQSS